MKHPETLSMLFDCLESRENIEFRLKNKTIRLTLTYVDTYKLEIIKEQNDKRK